MPTKDRAKKLKRKKWLEKNRAALSAYHKSWRKQNPDKINASRKKWEAQNREKVALTKKRVIGCFFKMMEFTKPSFKTGEVFRTHNNTMDFICPDEQPQIPPPIPCQCIFSKNYLLPSYEQTFFISMDFYHFIIQIQEDDFTDATTNSLIFDSIKQISTYMGPNLMLLFIYTSAVYVENIFKQLRLTNSLDFIGDSTVVMCFVINKTKSSDFNQLLHHLYKYFPSKKNCNIINKMTAYEIIEKYYNLENIDQHFKTLEAICKHSSVDDCITIWTNEEDKKLLQLFGKHGTKKWIFIAKQMKRSPQECKERIFQFVRFKLRELAHESTRPWAAEEVLKILNKRESRSNWCEMSSSLQKCTPNAVKGLYDKLKAALDILKLKQVKTEPSAVDFKIQGNNCEFVNSSIALVPYKTVEIKSENTTDDCLTDLINTYAVPEETVIDASCPPTSISFQIQKQQLPIPVTNDRNDTELKNNMSMSETITSKIVTGEKKVSSSSEKLINNFFVTCDKKLSLEIISPQNVSHLTSSSQQCSMVCDFEFPSVCKNEVSENQDLLECPITVIDVVSLSKV